MRNSWELTPRSPNARPTAPTTMPPTRPNIDDISAYLNTRAEPTEVELRLGFEPPAVAAVFFKPD